MEFNEKLQELRKRRGLTQDELAEKLFVSRTAISKWDSGRGYPNIDSLKALSKFFSVSLDDLLSCDEILAIAEETNEQRERKIQDLVFGLLDLCVISMLVLPFFAQRSIGSIQSIPLTSLTEIRLYLKIAFWVITIGHIISGISTLALQSCQKTFWIKSKVFISLTFSIIGVLVYLISLQPYAAGFLFIFLIIKTFTIAKQR